MELFKPGMNENDNDKYVSQFNSEEFDKDIAELLEMAFKAELKKALDLLENSTKQNSDRAYDIIGNLAVKYKYIPAIFWMGNFAEGSLNDMPQACYWYKMAADMGDGNGARNYADMLLIGRGVQSDRREAMKYYEKASDAGIPDAAFIMGEFLRNDGDRENALKYYQKALDGGYTAAQMRIEQMNNDKDSSDGSENGTKFWKIGEMNNDEVMSSIKKPIKDGSGNKETGSPKADRSGSETPTVFYERCLLDYHNEAQKLGYAENGIIFIPELLEYGKQAVLWYLKDEKLLSDAAVNPAGYYYVAVKTAISCGILFGDKWHHDFSCLKTPEYVEFVMEQCPWVLAKEIIKEELGMDKYKFNDFCETIFRRWLELLKPYWDLKDPRNYIFNAILAAFHLGVSTIICKYGL